MCHELKKLNHKQESIAKKKSMIEWISLRDSNSRFYHAMINWRRLKNEISGVKVNEEWCEELGRCKGRNKKILLG